MDTQTAADPFAEIVGQQQAVTQLRLAAANPVHAYALVGPRGCGKRSLAAAFGAALLTRGLEGADAERAMQLALAEEHPDLIVIERVGAAISAEQAAEVVRAALMQPVEASCKVIVLDEFHLIDARVGPKLLKTIEEPPGQTVFIVLAEQVTPELVTIASRCVKIDLAQLRAADIAARLVDEGVDPGNAERVAQVAVGDLGRARLLATDSGLDARRELWQRLPETLDGSGAKVVVAVDELLAAIDEAQAPLDARHEAERSELDERAEALGERGSGRRELEARHKRETRRHRSDELRFGLTVLADRCCREASTATDPRSWIQASDLIAKAVADLARNPNERLQLQGLFCRLRCIAQ